MMPATLGQVAQAMADTLQPVVAAVGKAARDLHDATGNVIAAVQSSGS